MVNWAAEIKVRAERRAGEMLAESDLSPGNPQWSHDATIGKLSDIGVTKHESSRWQLIAKVPEPEFEAYVEQTKDSGRELTSTTSQKNILCLS